MILSRKVRAAHTGLMTSLICLLLAAGADPGAACAQNLQQQEVEQTGLAARETKTWDVFLGAAVAATNTYEGSESYRVRVTPLFLVSYRDELFLGPLGLAWKAIDWNGLRAGPVLGLLGGRRQDLAPILNGLGDVPSSVAAGVFANYRLAHFQLSTTFRQAVTHTENGWVGLVQLDYRASLIPHRLGFFIGPEAQFANHKYAQTFFGITSVQSVDSGLPLFTPSGGVKDYGVHAGLTYTWSQHIVVRVFADEKWLGSDFTGSPIVVRKTETLVGIGAAYHF
jgi:outer membrane scaffolding protein for murein synthesis (MipA/OmpV family)